jgi:hypothetical protein
MPRAFAVALLFVMCTPLLASDEPVKADPVAEWLNDHSHEVMQGTLALMALVGNHKAVDDALVTVDAMVTSLAAAEGLKLVIDQPRPRDPSATDGFPSSHATTAFAFASGIDDWRPDWGPYAWAFAAGVGWARVEEGYHTTEQVLAGAALGLWIAGASLENDGFIIHRGYTAAPRLTSDEQVHLTPGFEGRPSVVLWKQSW